MPLARRTLLASAALWTMGARASLAVPAEVAASLPGARVQGTAWMRFMGIRVYEARLWTGLTAVPEDWVSVPLALEIEYARTLKGVVIAGRSLTEMRRQGEIEAATAQRWLATMRQLFPDVNAGDRLTALHRPGEGLQIFANGQLRGAVDEPAFAQRFLGIWLARQTSEPALRTALLGRGDGR